MTNNHLFYSLPLLVMFPRYIAPSGEEKSPAAYCLDKQNVTVDWSHQWSLHNWVETYDLACVDPYLVATMGSMYFAGTTVFNLIVTRLGDVYGRKLPVRVSSLISFPVQAGIIWSSNIFLTSALFFVFGALGPGKC